MLKLRGRLGASNGSEDVEINMAPLIDMVFILLIFFLVTTSFVREAGLEVNRPTAATAQAGDKGAMMAAVGPQGDIYVDHRKVDLRSIRGLVERFLAENPQGAVVIVADKESQTGRVIDVLDQARLAGAKNVSVAATRKGR